MLTSATSKSSTLAEIILVIAVVCCLDSERPDNNCKTTEALGFFLSRTKTDCLGMAK